MGTVTCSSPTPGALTWMACPPKAPWGTTTFIRPGTGAGAGAGAGAGLGGRTEGIPALVGPEGPDDTPLEPETPGAEDPETGGKYGTGAPIGPGWGSTENVEGRAPGPVFVTAGGAEDDPGGPDGAPEYAGAEYSTGEVEETDGDEDTPGAIEGVMEGAMEGAIEGAKEGAIEGAVEGFWTLAGAGGADAPPAGEGERW